MDDAVKNAKVGDILCYMNSFGYPVKVKIIKITKGGALVDNHKSKWKNGKMVGTGRFNSTYLKPVTQEIDDIISSLYIRNSINEFDYTKISIDKLKEIYKVIYGKEYKK